jgi:hypothetical protein
VDTVITHPDGIASKGGSFELGLRAFETQIPDPAFGLLNFADLDLIGYVPVALLQKDTDFPQSRVRWSLDSVIVTDVDLGMPNTGDTLSYVFTLTLDGTTHGFERGYDAFLGDPFGVDVLTDNLGVAVTPVTGEVPEPRGFGFAVLGFTRLWLRRQRRSSRATAWCLRPSPMPIAATHPGIFYCTAYRFYCATYRVNQIVNRAMARSYTRGEFTK